MQHTGMITLPVNTQPQSIIIEGLPFKPMTILFTAFSPEMGASAKGFAQRPNAQTDGFTVNASFQINEDDPITSGDPSSTEAIKMDVDINEAHLTIGAASGNPQVGYGFTAQGFTTTNKIQVLFCAMD